MVFLICSVKGKDFMARLEKKICSSQKHNILSALFHKLFTQNYTNSRTLKIMESYSSFKKEKEKGLSDYFGLLARCLIDLEIPEI